MMVMADPDFMDSCGGIGAPNTRDVKEITRAKEWINSKI
jgi:hypothetical protein